MQKLREEINIKHKYMRYRKLIKQYLLNRFEKHNVEILFKAIERINK